MKRKIVCITLWLLLAVNLFPGCVQGNEIEQLSHVKVASWYRLIDYETFNRTLDDVITHLKETYTDFVFRAFWRYKVIPEEYYDALEEAIDRIKAERPDTIVCAGIPTERVNAVERNPITGRNYSREETWAMALDPQKWNISISKEEFQWNRGRLLGFIPSWMDTPDEYDWTKASAYYPDITNPAFQELQLSWAKHLVDHGVDAIWIDMLFAQARIFYELTKDPYHPAVKEAYEAALKQIDEIHNYGKEKGKYIYVGGWTNFLEIKDENGEPAYPIPHFDFVVNMIWENEVKNKTLFEERWDVFLGKVKKYLGDDVLVLIFMDEAAVKWQDQPLGIFSQLLTKEEQRGYLRKVDEFFRKKRAEFGLPIVFVYPLHGGWMGSNAEILSYGKYKIYDALAPEFQTYETIKELAHNKSEGNPMIYIEKPRGYLYIFDREIAPLKNTIIIGRITVIVETYDEDGIEKVAFYVDDELRAVDDSPPYEWLWNERVFGKQVLKVVAYDNEGNKAESKTDVIIFNSRGRSK